MHKSISECLPAPVFHKDTNIAGPSDDIIDHFASSSLPGSG